MARRRIHMRTLADWSDALPGFLEAELIAHDGGSAFGDFLCTLTLTDLATGWTEAVAVINKAQTHVFDGLRSIRGRLPFAVLGIRTVNGSEPINDHLVRYCKGEGIPFARSLPVRKADRRLVERRKDSPVHRIVGHARLDSRAAFDVLAALYDRLRLLANFAYPSLAADRRRDAHQSPYQRILAHSEVPAEEKAALAAQCRSLDLIKLADELLEHQEALRPLVSRVTNPFKPYKVFHAQASSAGRPCLEEIE